MFQLISHKIRFKVSHFSFFVVFILLNASTTHAQENSGDLVFDESYVHEIRMSFLTTDFWEDLTENYNNGLDQIDPTTGELIEGPDKIYLQAELEIDGNNAGIVGIRQKGFFSNWGAGDSNKKPLKINFNEFVSGQSYDGLKKLNLHNGFQDPSMMRDAVAYKLFRANDIPAPRTSYARIYLNDVYWGLYLVVEQIDKTFLETHFPNNEGNLFKCDGNTSLAWEGTDFNIYAKDFDLKTNEIENNWQEFIDFIDVINNTAVQDFETALQDVFVVDDYLKVLALDVMMNNWDSYYGQGRNFYLYFDTEQEKFHWIPWDYNLSFMDYETELLIGNAEAFFGEAYTEKVLTTNILANENLRLEYLQHICNLKQEYFNLNYLEAYIDATASLIEGDLNTDPNKFFSMNEFENGTSDRPALKSFVSNRLLEITDAFENLNFDCFVLNNANLSKEKQFQFYPNPATNTLHVTLNQSDVEASSIELINNLGVVVYYKETTQQSLEINTDLYSSGLYFLQIQIGEDLWRSKLVIK